ncbi:MAG: trehalose-phosphatase [Candidatus Dormibacteraceae bacterium]
MALVADGGFPGAAALPSALAPDFARELQGRRPAVFLDYDGTLTPIVERPQDALLSPRMRQVVSELAARCPVCVVSCRDRGVVQELMGIRDLTVAGSHGFDIWSPERGSLHRQGAQQAALIERVTGQLREEAQHIPGALVEPKAVSVAVHYRQVDERRRDEVLDLVERLLAEHEGRLKVTPGKMVREIQPAIDWDKGRAVLYLLHVLDLEGEGIAPLYLGDDETDEDAFTALRDRGVGILVLEPDADPPRRTAARFTLQGTGEVERFLDAIGR